jgi:F0F1-type ATP synthase epsilon subunit
MVMNIRVLTPDRVICSTTADEIVLPGLTGQVVKERKTHKDTDNFLSR